MKVRYDPTVDAAYITLSGDDESAAFGFTYACDPKEVVLLAFKISKDWKDNFPVLILSME
jgi:hypothetical protein